MKNKLKKKRLTLIGVGPGAPDLISLRALRALEKAEVIALPSAHGDRKSLALETVRPYLREDQELLFLDFPMSRDMALCERKQREAAEKLAGLLEEGRETVLLSIGDVSLYCTGIYVLRFLSEKGFAAELIPGISAPSAAAAAGISLAEQDEQLCFVTGKRGAAALPELLKQFDTVVIFKAGKYLEEIQTGLQKEGCLETALIAGNVGMPDECILRFADRQAAEERLSYFTTVIVRRKKQDPAEQY